MLDIDRQRICTRTKWTIALEFQVWDPINVSMCLATTVDVVTNCQGYSLIPAAIDAWVDSLDMDEQDGVVVTLYSMNAEQFEDQHHIHLDDVDKWWEHNLVKFEIVNVEYNDEPIES